ncbi:XAP5, circadian clock regulator-domain-containing protein [Emericellopsis atlantica]|uniref:XAP5, circadian clock regulator-domain-containing protein n=1 Tax=Emericellopsis atlantica TaxID=2614577 RepID=A0A9P8CLT2_9HYPO|nr:XAP5, circadian clock regulator-domain-containing protein [Emericellopsis atlantica]KAG9251984.1 XAP5, circadian clock regulator-domain-containing protein [Emericellopsis atlantica]
MSDSTPPQNSRFTAQATETSQRLSSNTVGLVSASDYRKRRAELLDQQDRESREASTTGTGTSTGADTTPADSEAENGSVEPVKKKAKKKNKGKKLLSFDDDEDDDTEGQGATQEDSSKNGDGGGSDKKFKANASVKLVPKAMTKAALRKEATQREALRKEFLSIQDAVKNTEIAIPFVFYDGADIPGGTVRVKKGDFVWFFLDKSRKVGADMGVGETANATRAWARVGVDDLMLVRGSIIIPHHYDFYYFLVNKSTGPGGQRIFSYSSDPPSTPVAAAPAATEGLSTAETKAAAIKALPDAKTLEGANDDPTLTKVVDRRWYERNKHIFPASTWQDFDAGKDYAKEVRRDAGGNTFFFSR